MAGPDHPAAAAAAHHAVDHADHALHSADAHSGLEHSDESDFDDEPYASDESASLTWISWFCSLKGHEYFCEVPDAFIEDEFNLTGLSQSVNYYVEALDTILDIEDDSNEPQFPEEIEAIDSSAEILYGLIHARYILTRQGLDQMADKYENAEFGTCPRVCCAGSPVVPCGRVDLPERDSVKLFCPSCSDIYAPPSSRYQKIDGAYFGTTFPHMFFQTFPALVPDEPISPYTPRIYGFAISERSRAGPRMQWLRMLPDPLPEHDDDDAAGAHSSDDQSFVEADDGAADELLPTATATATADDALTESMDVGTDRRRDYSSSAAAAAA
ncbi:casein kinase 2 regulatory subunit [Coemansia interrupta]|uniref:Casein kinase II subunit beta n=1 Tax=Coemansia interrupta TaxID=1126814 RepID=A0A9W8HPM1_9FUNG|nr:casein kinase 2 regulatory subunit [Coemansia interrupta]